MLNDASGFNKVYIAPGFTDLRYDIKFCAELFIVICGGMLTQYFFLISLACTCVFCLIYLLYKRRITNLIKGIVTIIASLVCAYLIFLASLYHMLSGSRGTETIGNMGVSDLPERVNAMLSILNGQAFGGKVYYIIAVIIIAAVVVLVKSRVMDGESIGFDIKYIIVLFPVILAFIIISKVAVYLTDRYIMAVMVQLLLGVFLTL